MVGKNVWEIFCEETPGVAEAWMSLAVRDDETMFSARARSSREMVVRGLTPKRI